MLEGFIDVSEGAAFKKGVQYKVGNGPQIPNLGERRFVGFTEDGAANNIVAQVCAVDQGLMGVRQMKKKDNRVVFDDAGSYIEDKASGARTWMHDEGSMYSLKMWVSGVARLMRVFSGQAHPFGSSKKRSGAQQPVRPKDEKG